MRETNRKRRYFFTHHGSRISSIIDSISQLRQFYIQPMPTATTMSEFKFACPQCQQHIQADLGYVGMEIACPTCSTRIIVPQPFGMQAPPPPPVSIAPPPVSIAPPPLPAPPSLSISRPAPAAAPASAPAPAAARGVPQRPAAKKPRGKDGWSKDETDLNKVGTYIIIIAAIVAATLSGGFFEISISPLLVCAVVGACGIVGGALNILGRGPIWAGMISGMVFALGAYGMVFLWMSFRKNGVYFFEVIIAVVIGAIPGMLLQMLFQKMVQKRAGA
jgi:DNA-directed RNA polymerase subunit RPC12/RpoP